MEVSHQAEKRISLEVVSLPGINRTFVTIDIEGFLTIRYLTLEKVSLYVCVFPPKSLCALHKELRKINSSSLLVVSDLH